MAFWSKRPSATDQLIAVLREERAAHVKMTEAMLGAMNKQAELVQGYFKLFTEQGQPEVRVMTDAEEARREAERLGPITPPSQYVPVELDRWLAEVNTDIVSLKREIN